MKYIGGGVFLVVLWAWMVTGLAMQRKDFATRWPRWARWADRTSSVALPLMMFVATVLATGLVVLSWTR